MPQQTTDTGCRPEGGRDILLLSLAAFVTSANIRIADPLLPQIAEGFSTTVTAASSVVTVYALTYGLCQMVHGPLGDRFGKLRIVALMMFVSCLATGLTALSSSLGMLVALRLASGASAAAVIPLSMAHIGDTVPYERRQEVLARYLSGLVMGTISGQAAGGILGQWLGWQGVFVVLSGAYGVVALLLWRKAAGTTTGPTGARITATGLIRGWVALARTPKVQFVVGTVFAESFLFYGAFAFVGAFLRQEYGQSYAAIGLLLAAFGLGALIYSLLARMLVRRLGQGNMARASGVLLVVAFLWLSTNPPVWTVGGAILLAGLGFYLIHNTLQTHATQMAPEMRGVAMSCFAASFFLGQSAGVILDGQVSAAFGYRPLFAATGLLLCGLTFWFAHRLGTAADAPH